MRTAAGKLGLGGFIFLMLLFFWINAEAVYAVFADEIRQVLLLYLIMLIGLLAVFREELPGRGEGAGGLAKFALFFAITYPVALAITTFLTPQGSLVATIDTFERLALAIGFGSLHAFGKAYVEEASFRGVLMKRLGQAGPILSSIIFGIFHANLAFRNASQLVAAGELAQVAVIPYVLQVFMFLTIIGFVWALVARRFGLLASTGSHTAWNMVILGVRF